jgi:hypothetical protein
LIYVAHCQRSGGASKRNLEGINSNESSLIFSDQVSTISPSMPRLNYNFPAKTYSSSSRLLTPIPEVPEPEESGVSSITSQESEKNRKTEGNSFSRSMETRLFKAESDCTKYNQHTSPGPQSVGESSSAKKAQWNGGAGIRCIAKPKSFKDTK